MNEVEIRVGAKLSKRKWSGNPNYVLYANSSIVLQLFHKIDYAKKSPRLSFLLIYHHLWHAIAYWEQPLNYTFFQNKMTIIIQIKTWEIKTLNYTVRYTERHLTPFSVFSTFYIQSWKYYALLYTHKWNSKLIFIVF